eukprot:gene15221-16796_t
MLSINFLQEDSFYSDYENDACEDCDVVIAQEQFRQCQLGFCGTLLCPQCVQFCESCLFDAGNSIDNLFVFCRRCAAKVRPKCFSCDKRFCRQCSALKKCMVDSCKRLFCNDCTLKQDNMILATGKCRPCSSKQFNSLQDLCKRSIRMILATSERQLEDGKRRNAKSPTCCINEAIRGLAIPHAIKELLIV